MAYREINVKKTELVKKIKENFEAHKKDYIKAVEAYKLEVQEQLKNGLKKIKADDLEVVLKVEKPVDRTTKFNELLQVFEWETQEDIKLSQPEFNEYVLDKSVESDAARLRNALYKSKFNLLD